MLYQAIERIVQQPAVQALSALELGWLVFLHWQSKASAAGNVVAKSIVAGMGTCGLPALLCSSCLAASKRCSGQGTDWHADSAC